MPDASGTPTSPDNIPTFNTAVDPPSGKGFNTAMAQIQTIITELKAGTLPSGKIAVAGINASGTPSATTFLRGDASWATPSGLAVLADLTLGASQASFDTNTILGGNIPSGYKHLLLYVHGRTDAAATDTSTILMRMNNDSLAGHYAYEVSQASGTTPGAVEQLEGGTTGLEIGVLPASTAAAGIAGSIRTDIPHYNDTVWNKNTMSQFNFRRQSTTTNFFAGIVSGQFDSASAVTRLQIFVNGGANFITGTRFTLYGMP